MDKENKSKAIFYEEPFSGVNAYKILNAPLFFKGVFPPFILMGIAAGVLIISIVLINVHFIVSILFIVGSVSFIGYYSNNALKEKEKNGEQYYFESLFSFKKMPREIVDTTIVLKSFVNK